MGSFIISQEVLEHPPAKHSHTQVCLCGFIRYRLTNDSGEVRMWHLSDRDVPEGQSADTCSTKEQRLSCILDLPSQRWEQAGKSHGEVLKSWHRQTSLAAIGSLC